MKMASVMRATMTLTGTVFPTRRTIVLMCRTTTRRTPTMISLGTDATTARTRRTRNKRTRTTTVLATPAAKILMGMEWPTSRTTVPLSSILARKTEMTTWLEMPVTTARTFPITIRRTRTTIWLGTLAMTSLTRMVTAFLMSSTIALIPPMPTNLTDSLVSKMASEMLAIATTTMMAFPTRRTTVFLFRTRTSLTATTTVRATHVRTTATKTRSTISTTSARTTTPRSKPTSHRLLRLTWATTETTSRDQCEQNNTCTTLKTKEQRQHNSISGGRSQMEGGR